MKASIAICTAAMLWSALASGALAQVSIKPSESADSAIDSSGATEAQRESARQHFKLGVDFYRERNFRAALIEFQRAYADAPHYKLLYNLGQASLELQEYASAIDFLTDYLKEGGSEIAPERAAEVEQTIRYLESRIAYVRVVTNEDGADLYVDDTLVGKSPLAQAVRVGAGRHKFSAVREGQPPVERRIDVAAGDESEVRLDFNQQADRAASATPSAIDDTYEEPGSSTNTAAIVMAAATGALLVGAVTMTIVTGIAQQDYQEELLVATTRPALDDLKSDAETKALVTDILWGATAASAVVTTVLFVLGGNNGNEAEDVARHERGVSVHAGLGTLAVSGQF